MGRNHGERLARLESEQAQQRKELERLFEKARAVESLRPDLEKLLAWRSRVHERARYCTRAALWLAVAISLQYASGAWARILGDFAKQLARGLV